MLSETQKLIKRLLSRRDDLVQVLSQCRIVDDVLAGRGAVIGMSQDKKQAPKTITIDPAKGLGGMDPKGADNCSKYLFKDVREHADEYKKRLAMTPFVVQLNTILQSRQGTLAKAAVTVDVPDPMKPFLDAVTLKGMTFPDVRAKLAEMSQTGGYAGILLDRMPMPLDTTGRTVTVAEAEQRKLGRPIWALYPSAQILDWREDASGLTWVKLIEESCVQQDWKSDEQYVKTVRVVDRQFITVYTVTSPEDFDINEDPPDKATIAEAPPVSHGAIDDDKNPVVPFRMAHPFPARDGIGRSVLEGTAELDIASLRILSAILWCLHIAGDPQLVLTTNRESTQIPDIGLGVTHYLVLQAAIANVRDAETIEFLQLDVKGLEKLEGMYDKCVALARAQAEKMSGAAMQGPREQTGISKAWSFKTGEERILFLLAECLEGTFNWLLKLTARYFGADPKAVKCCYPHAYDVEGPIEVTELVEQVLPIAKGLDQKEATKQLMRKLFTALDLNWNEAMEKEWDAISSMELRPEAMLAAPSGDGGGAGDPNAQQQQKALQKAEPIEEAANADN